MLVKTVVFLQVERVQEIFFYAQGIGKRFGVQCGARSPGSSQGLKGHPLADNIRRC